MTLVLFDIDGTLLTTNGASRGIIQRVLGERTGRPVTTDGVAFAGRTDPAIMFDLLSRSGLDPVAIDRDMPDLLSEYADALEAHLRPEHVTVLPGVEALLEAVADMPGITTGLLTGNVRQTAFAKLRAGKLDGMFSWGAFGCDHVDRNALPQIARNRALENTGLDFRPEETIIIGDTEHDIACSRHHGAWAVCVCTGRQTRAMLIPHAPDLLVDHLHPAAPVLSFIARIAAARH